MDTILNATWGDEWRNLPHHLQDAVRRDFAELLRDEYDVPDPTMDDGIVREQLDDAVIEYQRRIGRGNLRAYADCIAD